MTAIEQLDSAELLAAIRFDADGLVPVIAQRHGSGEVLMLAYMNREALEESLAMGQVRYWSRSRRRLPRTSSCVALCPECGCSDAATPI